MGIVDDAQPVEEILADHGTSAVPACQKLPGQNPLTKGLVVRRRRMRDRRLRLAVEDDAARKLNGRSHNPNVINRGELAELLWV